MEKVCVKKIYTESINAEMNRRKNIKSTVNVSSIGVGCWKGEQEIRLSLTASGTVIVNDCKELFFREDELGEIEHHVTEEGTKYVMIKFLSKFPTV